MNKALTLAEKKFIEKHSELGKTSPKIAEQLGISVWTVRKWKGLIKKGGLLEPLRGRPRKGFLSSYPKELRDLIYQLREYHGDWGAITILLELGQEYGYKRTELPSAII